MELDRRRPRAHARRQHARGQRRGVGRHGAASARARRDRRQGRRVFGPRAPCGGQRIGVDGAVARRARGAQPRRPGGGGAGSAAAVGARAAAAAADASVEQHGQEREIGDERDANPRADAPVSMKGLAQPTGPDGRLIDPFLAAAGKASSPPPPPWVDRAKLEQSPLGKLFGKGLL